jgi:LacI family transcriptional regulator
VIISDSVDPYIAQILKGVENSLYQSSYLSILADIQNHRARFERYVEMLLERRVEGLITIANSLLLDTDLLEVLGEKKIPMVVIGRETRSNSMSAVVIDNEPGTRAGMEHLYALGNRQIAFIKGPKQVVDSNQRWQGICGFAQEVGLKLDPRLIVELEQTASSYQGGYEAMRRLLSRRRPFTALMAFDDMTAFGAIRALHKAGRKVPEDCAVIGFDDIAAAAFYNPPLTTIRQPMERLGTLAVEILTEAVEAALNNRTFTAVNRRITPELVVRESTPPLRVARPRRPPAALPAAEGQ